MNTDGFWLSSNGLGFFPIVDGFEMAVHVSALGELPATRNDGTGVWLFSGVRPLVLRERGIVTERVIAVGAFKGSLSCVNPRVSRQAGPLHEIFVTLLALIATAGL